MLGAGVPSACSEHPRRLRGRCLRAGLHVPEVRAPHRLAEAGEPLHRPREATLSGRSNLSALITNRMGIDIYAEVGRHDRGGGERPGHGLLASSTATSATFAKPITASRMRRRCSCPRRSRSTACRIYAGDAAGSPAGHARGCRAARARNLRRDRPSRDQSRAQELSRLRRAVRAQGSRDRRALSHHRELLAALLPAAHAAGKACFRFSRGAASFVDRIARQSACLGRAEPRSSPQISGSRIASRRQGTYRSILPGVHGRLPLVSS